MEKVNLFIVGAGKSGTTALANQLSALDDVFLPQVKEPHYFAMYDDEKWAEVDHFGSIYVQDFTRYCEMYTAHQNEKYLVDASTSYLHRTGTARRIHEYNSDAKIVMLLRNPVDRAYSHFLMSRQVGHTRSDFLSAIKNEYLESETGISYYIRIGQYAGQVEEYLQVFPAASVKIILYDDYSNDIVATFKDLLSFLKIDNRCESYEFLNIRHNETLLPRNKAVSSMAANRQLTSLAKRILGARMFERLKSVLLSKDKIKGITVEERQQCLTYFSEDIKRLETIIKRDLSTWYTHEQQPTTHY